ncbi:hypothetical protein C4553_02300 [Candidatus Parcubacteria bacterium]|nr:MAG: hypothetical protein C4553_02300 [Candidatus Parcubacteria bacterium]
MASTGSFQSINGTVGVIMDPEHSDYGEVVHFLGDYNSQNDDHSVLTPRGVETLRNSQVFFMQIDRDVDGVCRRLKANKEDMIAIRKIFTNEASSPKDRTWARNRLTEILNGQASSCS